MISLYNDISTLNYDTLFCFEFELHNSSAITDNGFWKLIHYTLVTSLSSTWELKLIHAMWNQRSVDTFLGLPFNIASYAMLLTIIADEVNMIPGDLIGNLGDVHLYNNHIEQAKEQIKREPFKLPEIHLIQQDVLNGEFEYKINNYESHPTIKAPLSN